jgi:hypothetical protein
LSNQAWISITQLLNFPITEFSTQRNHGQYIEAVPRRSKKIQTHCAQEAQGGKTVETARLSTRIEKAQSQETGARSGKTVRKKAFGTQHSALGQLDFRGGREDTVSG